MPILLAAAIAVLTPLDQERGRIQAHLARVEAELRAADLAGLGPAERRWRARLLDELHRYWTRGRFPRNTVAPRLSPVFVDRAGTRCAVAELVHASGHDGLVARVAAVRNTATIAELAGDAELARWLAEHGFTAEEAARIQPSYGPPAPAAVGEPCSSNPECASGICLDFQESLGYCSEPCGADGSCPAGVGGVAMTCDDDEPRPLCRYPSPAPGRLGWPCDQAPGCYGECLRDEPVPTCTSFCSNLDECPEGYDCRAREDSSGYTVCVPPTGGRCAIGGGRGGLLTACVLLLALRRRRRAA